MNTKQKQIWDKLAKMNSKYFINSDYGKNITEDEFDKSGRRDWINLIWSDGLLTRRNGPFLEIGCGNGRILEHVWLFSTTTIGTDISGEMIRQARERSPNKYFIETDGYTLPLADDSIGIVFSYLVFQHMRTKEMVESNFKEVFRILKKGGIFKVRIRTDEVRQDKWWSGVAYTKEDITKLVNKIGYNLLKTQEVEDYGLWVWVEKPLNLK